MFALFEPPICLRMTQTLLLRALRDGWSYDARFFGQGGFHILGPCDKAANGCLRLSFQHSMFTPFLSLRFWCNFFPLDELSCQPRRVVDICNSVWLSCFTGYFSPGMSKVFQINGWLTVASASSSLLLDILCHFRELILIFGFTDPRFTVLSWRIIVKAHVRGVNVRCSIPLSGSFMFFPGWAERLPHPSNTMPVQFWVLREIFCPVDYYLFRKCGWNLRLCYLGKNIL